jgi:hypothetical protein
VKFTGALADMIAPNVEKMLEVCTLLDWPAIVPIRLWQIIEASLDVRAAAASGVLIVVTLLLLIIFERAVGLSRHMR